MIKSGFEILDNVRLQLFGPDGKLKQEVMVHNTVPPLGDAFIANQLSSQSESAMSHMACGAGTPSDTVLGSELTRVALDSTTQGTGADDNDVVYVCTFGAGVGTGAWTEAGVFNDPSSGVMFVSASFDVINKGAADSMVVTWTVTCGST